MKNSIKNNVFGAVVYFTTALLLNNGIKKTQQLEFHLLYWGLLLNIL